MDLCNSDFSVVNHDSSLSVIPEQFAFQQELQKSVKRKSEETINMDLMTLFSELYFYKLTVSKTKIVKTFF